MNTRADDLPIGIVTFMLSDIEGSTSLWEREPDAMRIALELHDAVMAHAVQAFGGRIFKSTGDGVHAVFASPEDALATSVQTQRALQSTHVRDAGELTNTPWPLKLKVRMGIHTGRVDLRGGDYYGTNINRAARVMAAAHGEQILISGASAELLRGKVPAGVTLLALGEHRLKGLERGEPLLQVAASGLRSQFPALSTQIGRGLPAERDAFIGREDDLLELSRRFKSGARIVSLLGTGGIGKTRLATRFGWRSLVDFPDGVWFCDLLQARNVDGVVQAVAQALDVPLRDEDPVAQLGNAIAGRGHCLIIFDNFEQVSSYAEQTLGRWIVRAGTARFLVTSRSVLGITGEEVMDLRSLPLADAEVLFRARAEAAHRDFRLSADDAAAIGPLVKMLDGLPLGIELAAARVRIMPPRLLLSRIQERFKLLTASGEQTGRHATLRSTFDWSWEYLSQSEREMLAQLSVFEGSYELGDVEAVVRIEEADKRSWIPDVLQSLVEKSMVRSIGDGRFELLRSMQDYAAEQLRVLSGYDGRVHDLEHEARKRHWWHFGTPLEHDVVEMVDNLVVACRRATAAGDARHAAGALTTLWSALRRTGPFRLAVELANGVLEIDNLEPVTRGAVNRIFGSANDLLGDFAAARRAFDAAIADARTACDRIGEGWALCALGEHLYRRGETPASRLALETALQIAVEIDERSLRSAVLNALGTLDMRLGDSRAARARYESALDVARSLRDDSRVGGLLGNLAILAHDAGDEALAMELYEQAIALAVRVNDRRWEGNTHCNLGLLLQERGDLLESEQEFKTALTIAREIGHVMLEGTVLCNLGILLDTRGDVEGACRLFEQAVTVAAGAGDRRAEGQFHGYLSEALARCGKITSALDMLAKGEASLAEIADEPSLGLLLCQRAVVEQLAGRAAAAQATLARARPRPGVIPTSEWRRAVERAEGMLAE